MDWQTPRGYHHSERKLQFLFPHYHMYHYQHYPDFSGLDISEINLKPETIASFNLEVSLL